jgi:arylsulfatase A-like enzyme
MEEKVMRLIYGLLIIIIIIASLSCRETIRNQPNFIIIFTDDQGYADVGCYGAKGFQTPNLDKMAEEGIRLTSFYAAPTCSPSRAALLTGSYPVRVGVPAVLEPNSPTGLDPGEVTLAEILKEQGYVTACVGKWHLGDQPEMMPTNQGFDEFFGLLYSNSQWPWRYNRLQKGPRSDLYSDLALYQNNEVVELNPDQNLLTTRYTEYALRFIEANRAKPFFLYLPHTMLHIPLGVSDKFAGETEYGLYGDVIEEIDWSVGEILQCLKKFQLDKKTLVIYTSDNGPPLSFGNHAGKAFPLREGKSTTFEGGIRVPCIMRWPGEIPAGFVSTEITTTMDLLPTIASMTGSQAPQDRKIDGKDISPIMRGEPGAKSQYNAFFYHWGSQLQAVRSGPWKLHFPHMYRHQTGKPGQDGNGGVEIDTAIGLSLFNLDQDIGETKNLANDYPNIVQKLTNLADEHLKDLMENSRASVKYEDIDWRRYQKKISSGVYITDWWLIGPFDNSSRKGMEKVYPPEKEFIPNQKYINAENKKVGWWFYEGREERYISLAKLFNPSGEDVVYARRIIKLKENANLKIGLGSNDGIKMWVNGKLIHSNVVARTAIPNDDILTVPFKKGENAVLLKIDQLGGGWGFFFTILEGSEYLSQ